VVSRVGITGSGVVWCGRERRFEGRRQGDEIFMLFGGLTDYLELLLPVCRCISLVSRLGVESM
jgi:hypothetical protein